MKEIFDLLDIKALEEDYDYLYENAEIGFELTKTKAYVHKKLSEMGIAAKKCGKCGLTALIGDKKATKTILLRADMDAINIEGKGVMHACGHAMHTAMLLSSARILKNPEYTKGIRVRLMFQSAEEILEGCKDMIDAGVIDDVDAAFMIHVTSGTTYPTGTVIFASAGDVAPSADFFSITVNGKGSHGAEPHKAIDPIIPAANIITALSNIQSRELPIDDSAVLTIGKIVGGSAANVIPDKVLMSGTIRTYSEETREFVKKRIKEITANISYAYRADGQVQFTSGCPPFKNDEEILTVAVTAAEKTLGKERVVQLPKGAKGGGSEDFSYVSRSVPTAMALLSAGDIKSGYKHPLHSPNVLFDKSALVYGTALMINIVREFGKQ